MPKPVITRESVLKAIDEFDNLGEELFLSRYGFHKARIFHLFYKGKYYPSKAIYGVACKFLPPDYKPLRSRDFVGGGPVLNHLTVLVFKLLKNKLSHSRMGSILNPSVITKTTILMG